MSSASQAIMLHEHTAPPDFKLYWSLVARRKEHVDAVKLIDAQLNSLFGRPIDDLARAARAATYADNAFRAGKVREGAGLATSNVRADSNGLFPPSDPHAAHPVGASEAQDLSGFPFPRPTLSSLPPEIIERIAAVPSPEPIPDYIRSIRFARHIVEELGDYPTGVQRASIISRLRPGNLASYELRCNDFEGRLPSCVSGLALAQHQRSLRSVVLSRRLVRIHELAMFLPPSVRHLELFGFYGEDNYPELPNITSLRYTIGNDQDEAANLATVFPNLETLIFDRPDGWNEVDWEEEPHFNLLRFPVGRKLRKMVWIVPASFPHPWPAQALLDHTRSAFPTLQEVVLRGSAAKDNLEIVIRKPFLTCTYGPRA
ncbi:hypothetical protein DFJ74DRAFT_701718 [Hyaloraphidium curvatum]|nr:hypothetical protein DFJ74DRAFT_701718 [Hyaloraphidium curvatum]